MKPLGDERHHYMLARTMAKVTGTDLESAHEDGRLEDHDWAEAVARCRTCEEPGACAHWLREHAAEGAAEPPGYCRNTRLFEALRLPAE